MIDMNLLLAGSCPQLIRLEDLLELLNLPDYQFTPEPYESSSISFVTGGVKGSIELKLAAGKVLTFRFTINEFECGGYDETGQACWGTFTPDECETILTFIPTSLTVFRCIVVLLTVFPSDVTDEMKFALFAIEPHEVLDFHTALLHWNRSKNVGKWKTLPSGSNVLDRDDDGRPPVTLRWAGNLQFPHHLLRQFNFALKSDHGNAAPGGR
jgi:hypothetical protein